MDHYAKPLTDVIAVSTIISAIAGWLPLVAAGFSIFWVFMQIVINWDKFAAKISEWIG